MTTPLDTCWKRIGTWGDSSCPELQPHIHCRNCPTYAAAAADLLDREPPAGYCDDWTQRIAQPRTPKLAGTKSLVIFRLGAEWLALATAVFQEVTDMRTIHSLPHRQGKVVKGLVNVRGELLVCVSLEDLLGLEMPPESRKPKPRAVYQRLLVVMHPSGRAAFLVGEVHSGHRYHPHELQPVPATVSLATARYSRGLLVWREHSVGVLDEELLFYTLNRSLA